MRMAENRKIELGPAEEEDTVMNRSSLEDTLGRASKQMRTSPARVKPQRHVLSRALS